MSRVTADPTMVHVYLDVGGSAVPFLSIPLNDVERLSIRPLKWLQFVAFTICGARGHLSLTPGGPPVAYDTASFADIVESYYYTASGKTSLFLVARSGNRQLREL